ncbi:MAG: hypothetical protein RRC34_06990 [Lentisphaeria bacterium]|nr:hypothetical protein [Lentisphaeria bacterium]
MIRVTVLNPKETLFAGEAESATFPGASGDFEVLEFHKPTISLLRKGRIVLDRQRGISVQKGIVRVIHDEVVALVEQ